MDTDTTTPAKLAAELGWQTHELRAFADDLLDGIRDNEPIPADAEAIIRDAAADHA